MSSEKSLSERYNKRVMITYDVDQMHTAGDMTTADDLAVGKKVTNGKW